MKSVRSLLYVVAKYLGDFSAVGKGKVGKRIGRRIAGRLSGRTLRKLFK